MFPLEYVLVMLLWNCITITSISPLDCISFCVCVCVCVYSTGILMRKPQRCDKYNMMKKGPWTPEEDAKLLAYVANHRIGNWTLVPDKAGLSRCGKSCRLRWTNYLRPDLKHDNFTPQEEELILDLHKAIGSRWSLIAKQLPGRTDNDVKNHWNTKLRKKLLKMGIDPVTHKPFSQILTEFGNITSLPNTRNHNDSLNNFLNNSILKPKHEFTTPLMVNTQMMKQFQDSVAHFQVTQLSSPQSFPCQGSHLQTTLPSSPSSWSNYLLADPSVQTTIEQDQERELQGIKSSSYPSVSMQATSSGADSFVDTILNKDNELQSEFPELFLGGYLNY